MPSIMKKTLLPVLTLLLSVIFFSCDKEGTQQVNTLTINEGEFSGYTHAFAPNQGFWSVADETTNYVHIVLGDDDNNASYAENVLTMVFYDTGSPQVEFPSTQGQWIYFGINIDGEVIYFRNGNALLSISYIDDGNFEGTLTGEFIDMSDASRTINCSMFIKVAMQQI